MPLDFLSLLQMVIVAMRVSLVLGNVIRIEIIVFRDFMTLVKHDQILSLFNQAYYYTNYCVFNKNVIRAAVLFSEILRLWLNRNKSCHYLTKPIITRIIMYLVFENVIIRIEIIVFRDFMSLVKYDQILSLFNQAYYCTNYGVFSV